MCLRFAPDRWRLGECEGANGCILNRAGKLKIEVPDQKLAQIVPGRRENAMAAAAVNITQSIPLHVSETPDFESWILPPNLPVKFNLKKNNKAFVVEFVQWLGDGFDFVTVFTTNTEGATPVTFIPAAPTLSKGSEKRCAISTVRLYCAPGSQIMVGTEGGPGLTRGGIISGRYL